jgi:uncharacterized protein (UPF0332 family)
MLDEDHDWAFSISYNAMLQSARALMFQDGYRALGENHHKAVVDYADAKLGAKFGEKIGLFDQMRRKRHHLIYDKAGTISGYEARHAWQAASDFLLQIEKKLKEG